MKRINIEKWIFYCQKQDNVIKNFYKGVDEYFNNELKKLVSGLDQKQKDKIKKFLLEYNKNYENFKKLWFVNLYNWNTDNWNPKENILNLKKATQYCSSCKNIFCKPVDFSKKYCECGVKFFKLTLKTYFTDNVIKNFNLVTNVNKFINNLKLFTKKYKNGVLLFDSLENECPEINCSEIFKNLGINGYYCSYPCVVGEFWRCQHHRITLILSENKYKRKQLAAYLNEKINNNTNIKSSNICDFFKFVTQEIFILEHVFKDQNVFNKIKFLRKNIKIKIYKYEQPDFVIFTENKVIGIEIINLAPEAYQHRSDKFPFLAKSEIRDCKMFLEKKSDFKSLQNHLNQKRKDSYEQRIKELVIELKKQKKLKITYNLKEPIKIYYFIQIEEDIGNIYNDYYRCKNIIKIQNEEFGKLDKKIKLIKDKIDKTQLQEINKTKNKLDTAIKNNDYSIMEAELKELETQKKRTMENLRYKKQSIKRIDWIINIKNAEFNHICLFYSIEYSKLFSLQDIKNYFLSKFSD